MISKLFSYFGSGSFEGGAGGRAQRNLPQVQLTDISKSRDKKDLDPFQTLYFLTFKLLILRKWYSKFVTIC